MSTRTALLGTAVLLAVLTGYFGATQQAKIWPFLLAASGVLFAVAAQRKH